MWRKLLLSALLTVVLVQCIVSVPTPSVEDDDSSSNEIEDSNAVSMRRRNDELPGRKALRLIAYDNLTSLLDFQLSSTYQIAKDVLADPAISSVDTEKMRNELTTLSNYVKEAKVTADARLPSNKTDRQSYFYFSMGRIIILEHFHEYARDRNASESFRVLNDEQKLVWEALLRHGYGEFRKEIQQRGELFAINFADAVLQYVDSLSPAEKENEASLVKVCQEYERHKSYDDKVEFGIALTHKV